MKRIREHLKKAGTPWDAATAEDILAALPKPLAEAIEITETLEYKREPAADARKRRLYEQQGGRCNAPRCATPMDLRHFEIDHIVPRSKGGPDDVENLQLLCGSCNKIKGDRDMDYLDGRLAGAEAESI